MEIKWLFSPQPRSQILRQTTARSAWPLKVWHVSWADKHPHIVMFNVYEATPNNLLDYKKAWPMATPGVLLLVSTRCGCMRSGYECWQRVFMCSNPLSYTETKLRSVVHIHTEFFKPYLARHLRPPKKEKKKSSFVRGEAAGSCTAQLRGCLIESRGDWTLLINPNPGRKKTIISYKGQENKKERHPDHDFIFRCSLLCLTSCLYLLL